MALRLLEFSRSRTRGGDGYWIGDINAAFDQDSVTLADIGDSGGLCLRLGRRCELTGKSSLFQMQCDMQGGVLVDAPEGREQLLPHQEVGH